MVKTITLGDKTYNMKSSAYTAFAYEDFTEGRKMLADVKTLWNLKKGIEKFNPEENATEEEKQKLQEESTLYVMDHINDIVRLGLSLAYVMIHEQDAKQIDSYDEWLKSLDTLFDNVDWIKEVLDCAMSTFQGKVQISK